MSHDYFTDVLATFLDLDLALLSTEGQRALGFDQKYQFVFQMKKVWRLKMMKMKKVLRFGTTWGWVIMTIIFIFGELSL